MAPSKNVTAAKEDDGRDLFRLQFKKTRLCSFHVEGRCRYGSACGFAHDDVQVETPPDLTKTSLCEKWQQGKCCNTAAACKFAHGKHELRITPQFARGREGKKKTKDKTQGKDTTKARRSKDKDQTGFDANTEAFLGSDMTDPLARLSAQTLSQIGVGDGFGLWEEDFGLSSPRNIVEPHLAAPSTWMGEPLKVSLNDLFDDELKGSAPMPESSIPFPEKLTRKYIQTSDWEGDTTTAGSFSDGHSSRSQSPTLPMAMRRVQAPTAMMNSPFAGADSGYSSFSGLPWNFSSLA